jgi:hypothetical protein
MGGTFSSLSADALVQRNHELLAIAAAARHNAERLKLQAEITWIDHCLRHRTPLEWRLAIAKWTLGTGGRPSSTVWQATGLARRVSARAAARRLRAAMSVRRATGMDANQLWKCASALHAVTMLAHTVEQRAELEARAERAEGLAWDKALRHQFNRADWNRG